MSTSLSAFAISKSASSGKIPYRDFATCSYLIRDLQPKFTFSSILVCNFSSFERDFLSTLQISKPVFLVFGGNRLLYEFKFYLKLQSFTP